MPDEIPTHLSDTGRFDTPHAAKYLRQLCKHFGHKIDVTLDETTPDAPGATLTFGMGPATLKADAQTLTAHVTAPDYDALAQARHIVDKHLERFAFREEFTQMAWDSSHG